MFKVIEGIYKKGKIIIPELLDIHDQTRVLIAFADRTSWNEDIANFAETEEIALEFPDSLDEVDVSVPTASLYKARLAQAVEKRKTRKILHSPFFSSSPVDIGYTDASLLDAIIAKRSRRAESSRQPSEFSIQKVEEMLRKVEK